MNAATLRAAVERELDTNLLPFWRERSIDRRSGGFIGEMANDGSLHPDAPRGLILNARLLWTFAALYRRLGNELDLILAERAWEVLEGRFLDRDHGGYRWRLDPAGRPLDSTKKIYGQAFCIYAASELYRATGRDEALAAARALFELIERHAHDDERLGYVEARAADWSATADLRLSAKDMNEAKSMNNHLHLLEAYANLYRIWPGERLATRLGELIDLFDRRIVARGEGRYHLHQFFDEGWNIRSGGNSWGHDIEAAWLLDEAAAVLGHERRQATVRALAIGLARTVLTDGLDAEGGLAYEGRDGVVVDGSREWWCQAEAVVGFWHAHRLTGDSRFADAAERVWRFIDEQVVDRRHGEWFWRVGADGRVDPDEPKVSEWKGPYHNVRMCLEIMDRTGEERTG